MVRPVGTKHVGMVTKLCAVTPVHVQADIVI